MKILGKRFDNPCKGFDEPSTKRIAVTPNLFNKLSPELIVEIMKKLPSIKDREALALTSKRIYYCAYYARIPETAIIFERCFFKRVRDGRLYDVKNFIDECGINPSCENNRAIVEAAKNGYLEIVKILLDDDRVDPTCFSFTNHSAFTLAAENGHIEIVKSILERNKTIPEVNKLSLVLAAENGHLKVVKLLAEIYKNSCGNALIKAVEGSHVKIVEYLLTNPNIHINEKDCMTAARLASRKDHVEIVKLLSNDKRLKNSLLLINPSRATRLLDFGVKNPK